MFKNQKINLIIVALLTLSFAMNVYAIDCNGVIGPELMSEISSIFRIIQIACPVLLLLLTSLDFAKVVFGDNKDGMEKAKSNFLKRSVALMIIFLAPFIIELVLKLINDASIRSAAECVNQVK